VKIQTALIFLTILLVVGFLCGFIVRGVIEHLVIPGAQTNSVAGNTVLEITNFTQMTNTMTNLVSVWDGYYALATSPFVFIQNNEQISATIALNTKWQRRGETTIKQWQKSEGFIVGGGWDVVRTAPGILAGYQWQNLGVLAQVTVATNFGAFVGGFWRVDIK